MGTKAYSFCLPGNFGKENYAGSRNSLNALGTGSRLKAGKTALFANRGIPVLSLAIKFGKIALFILLFSILSCSSAHVPSELAKNYPVELVRVRGKMFVWQVTHAGVDGQLDTVDDVKTENLIVVPEHRRLQLVLESEDVFHGFFLPALDIHRTLLPQTKIEAETVVETATSYNFACSEVCGVGHGKMLGLLKVLNPEDYQKWLDNLTSYAAHVTSPADLDKSMNF